jgi:hypothetical protein
MNYLMIQNSGVAPTEAFTLLGMSMTEGCGVRGAIGQFGSGNKLAINLLLRLGIKVYIYCGKTRLEFFTVAETISDGISQKEVFHVKCKFGGTSSKTIDCGWTLAWGSTDWKSTDMALREFVSNAIDRTIREKAGFKQAIMDEQLLVTPVMEQQRRAADGYTRVYVEMTESVHKFYSELPRRFLHFSDNPNQVYESVLPKAERNLSTSKTPMIYRCGVLVREISESHRPSLFDYNFKADEIEIDECRNSSEYATRAACAGLMGKVDSDTLAAVMKSMVRGEDTFESNLDADYILSSWDTPSEGQKESWKSAWDKANEDGPAILCLEGNETAVRTIEKKGYTPRKVKSTSWVNIARRMGVQHSSDILTDNEEKGREVIPATDAAIEAVNTVWSWLEALGMTKGKDKPKVRGFRELASSESSIIGYWEEGSNVVHLREDISMACNKFTLKAALKEVIHYVTGSTDCSRDLQQFAFDCIVELAT